MTNVIVSNRKIVALAIARKWPGAIIACKKQGVDTLVEWTDGGAVPVKTAAEIITAQDEHEAWLADPSAQDDRLINTSNIFNDKVLKAFIKAVNTGAFVPGSNYTTAQMKAIIKANI